MPALGLHLVVYATFAAAIVVATVRARRGDADRAADRHARVERRVRARRGSYFVGRSRPARRSIVAVLRLGFALVLLTVVVVERASPRAAARPSPPELAVLFGFALTPARSSRCRGRGREVQRVSARRRRSTSRRRRSARAADDEPGTAGRDPDSARPPRRLRRRASSTSRPTRAWSRCRRSSSSTTTLARCAARRHADLRRSRARRCPAKLEALAAGAASQAAAQEDGGSPDAVGLARTELVTPPRHQSARPRARAARTRPLTPPGGRMAGGAAVRAAARGRDAAARAPRSATCCSRPDPKRSGRASCGGRSRPSACGTCVALLAWPLLAAARGGAPRAGASTCGRPRSTRSCTARRRCWSASAVLCFVRQQTAVWPEQPQRRALSSRRRRSRSRRCCRGHAGGAAAPARRGARTPGQRVERRGARRGLHRGRGAADRRVAADGRQLRRHDRLCAAPTT